MINITSVRTAAQQLSSAPTTARDLARALSTTVAAARSHTDPLLSAEGLRAKRAELESAARQTAGPAVTGMRDRLASARASLAAAARENTQILDTPQDLIRSEQKWRQIERILDAGGDLRTEISRADSFTARAIAEFAPSYIEATALRPNDLDSTIGRALTEGDPVDRAAGVRRAVYERIAEVTTDASLRELLQAEIAADAQVAAAEPWLAAADSIVETGGANMLGVAIASQIAASDAASGVVAA